MKMGAKTKVLHLSFWSVYIYIYIYIYVYVYIYIYIYIHTYTGAGHIIRIIKKLIYFTNSIQKVKLV